MVSEKLKPRVQQPVETKSINNHMKELGEWDLLPVGPLDDIIPLADSLTATSRGTLSRGPKVTMSRFLTQKKMR